MIAFHLQNIVSILTPRLSLFLETLKKLLKNKLIDYYKLNGIEKEGSQTWKVVCDKGFFSQSGEVLNEIS